MILANYSFTRLHETSAKEVYPFCYRINAMCRDLSSRNYFPEKYLSEWFLTQNENLEMYAFAGVGVVPLKKAYDYLIEKYKADTVVLVDGGTDSLMFGDEEGLGTPEEDVCSMAAVYQSHAKKKYLLSIGFGIDHYHGVAHYRFLENVAELIRGGGYLGLFQVTKEMTGGDKLISAIKYVNNRMRGMESIVTNSVASAIEGHYRNYQVTERTKHSELWINPLMSIYWCFTLDSIISKNRYYDRIKKTHTLGQIRGEIARYRSPLLEYREKKCLPL